MPYKKTYRKKRSNGFKKKSYKKKMSKTSSKSTTYDGIYYAKSHAIGNVTY